MKCGRLFLLVILTGILLACATTPAFAGFDPQVAVADPPVPMCPAPGDGSSPSTPIVLGSTVFTFNASMAVTYFCNGTGMDFSNLNITAVLPSAIDLNQIYCGGPDAPGHDAFDSCMVLDPTKPPNPTSDPAYGGTLTSYLVHEFVTDPHVQTSRDTPSNFFTNHQCFFNCPGTTDMGSIVQIAFNNAPPVFIDPAPGLVVAGIFSINLGCGDVTNQNTIFPDCTPFDPGSNFAAQLSQNYNTNTFPAAVPEPATLTLLGIGGIASLLRRKKKA